MIDEICKWFRQLSNEILLAITSSILSSILTTNWTRYKLLYYNVFLPKELKILMTTYSLYNDSSSTKIDNYKKEYTSNEMYDMCKLLLKSNSFFYKNYNGIQYNYNYIKKLFQRSWENIFQYISLNQDILNKCKLKDELNNTIKKLKEFNITLLTHYTDITSNDKETLKQCYVFAHKQFVKNNIDKILNHPDANFIENWLRTNRLEEKYKYCIHTYYYYFSWDCTYDSEIGSHFANAEISQEVIKEILSLYLSNCEKLKEMKERYKHILHNINSSFNSVVESINSQLLEMYKPYKNNPKKFDGMLAIFCGINEHNIDEKLEYALHYDNRYNISYKQFKMLQKILSKLIFTDEN